jgi:hypothetical protein
MTPDHMRTTCGPHPDHIEKPLNPDTPVAVRTGPHRGIGVCGPVRGFSAGSGGPDRNRTASRAAPGATQQEPN